MAVVVVVVVDDDVGMAVVGTVDGDDGRRSTRRTCDVGGEDDDDEFDVVVVVDVVVVGDGDGRNKRLVRDRPRRCHRRGSGGTGDDWNEGGATKASGPSRPGASTHRVLSRPSRVGVAAGVASPVPSHYCCYSSSLVSRLACPSSYESRRCH